MVPLINSEMLSHGWMNAQEVSDIVAIAEMTPGPLGMNSSTFAGIRVAGIPGAIIAMLGILFPTLTIGFAAVVFFQKFRKSSIMKKMLYGIRPAGIGLVFASMFTLGLSNYMPGGAFDPAQHNHRCPDRASYMEKRYKCAENHCDSSRDGVIISKITRCF